MVSADWDELTNPYYLGEGSPRSARRRFLGDALLGQYYRPDGINDSSDWVDRKLERATFSHQLVYAGSQSDLHRSIEINVR